MSSLIKRTEVKIIWGKINLFLNTNCQRPREYRTHLNSQKIDKINYHLFILKIQRIQNQNQN